MPIIVSARVMQTPARDRLEVIEDAVIAVDDSGLLAAVETADAAAGRALLASDAEQLRTPAGTVLLPGLVDLHVHAPQWPQLGTGLDLPLERWLFEYTFPLEARYADLDFARPVWSDLVDSLLRHGTTTGVYFATVDGGCHVRPRPGCRRGRTAGRPAGRSSGYRSHLGGRHACRGAGGGVTLAQGMPL